MQLQENPCSVLLGLHGNSTEGFLLKNLYCLECIYGMYVVLFSTRMLMAYFIKMWLWTMTIHHSNLYERILNTWQIDWGKKPRVLSGQCPCYPARCIFNLVCLCRPIINQSMWIHFSSHPVGTRRCYDVESTSLTLIQRHWRWFNGAATPCAQWAAHDLVPALNQRRWCCQRGDLNHGTTGCWVIMAPRNRIFRC